MDDALEAIRFLNTDPSSADDFVSYITFVDKAEQQVDRMESRLDYVKEIYDIMEEYQITVPAENIASYLVCFFFYYLKKK